MSDSAQNSLVSNILFGHAEGENGTDHFWLQRMTAIANVPLTLFVIWFIAQLAKSGGDVAIFNNLFFSLVLVVAVFSVCWHMRLGMQIVIEDYVHGPMGKTLHVLNGLFTFVIGTVSILSILVLTFGG